MDRKTWRSSMLKKRWPFSTLIKFRSRRGPTRTNTVVRFVAARKKSSSSSRRVKTRSVMKQAPVSLIALLLGSFVIISDARTNTGERVVDFKSADGTILKGTYFAAAKPGPGGLLFHQSNRTRKSWDDVGRQLAAGGINALTVDTDPKKTRKQRWPG